VLAPIPVTAFAGPDQEVLAGKKLTLDGRGSTGPVKTYAWKQTGGPSADLSGADTPSPSFTAPTVDPDATLAFELTATGPSGSATDEVKISTAPDRLTTTRVQYSRSKGEWRVTGTSSLKGPGVTVTLHNGSTLAGPKIGTPAVVDSLGDREVRVDAPVNPAPTRASLESSAGSTLTNETVSVK
jgi:K319-like protein